MENKITSEPANSSQLADKLKDFPEVLRVQTMPEFDEICMLADAGRFRIFSIAPGRSGSAWAWEFKLVWPDRQMALKC